MKFCIDCIHRREGVLDAGNCGRGPKVRDLATGTLREPFVSCSSERYPRWFMARLFRVCGKEGRFFQPKEKRSCENGDCNNRGRI